jgi:NAD-dependent SIR2 family protein deacetylase
VVNVSTSGFNTSSVEGKINNSVVYGLLQCRGDLNSSECQHCTTTMKEMLVQKCQNNISRFIQIDDCFLRYNNHIFYNYSDNS